MTENGKELVLDENVPLNILKFIYWTIKLSFGTILTSNIHTDMTESILVYQGPFKVIVGVIRPAAKASLKCTVAFALRTRLEHDAIHCYVATVLAIWVRQLFCYPLEHYLQPYIFLSWLFNCRVHKCNNNQLYKLFILPSS